MFDTLIKFSKDREKLDFYATDKRATHELLKREEFTSLVYEPACGEGHIGKILEEYGYMVKATDICYRGYGEEREVDFFYSNRKYIGYRNQSTLFLCKWVFTTRTWDIRKGCKNSNALSFGVFRGAIKIWVI